MVGVVVGLGWAGQRMGISLRNGAISENPTRDVLKPHICVAAGVGVGVG